MAKQVYNGVELSTGIKGTNPLFDIDEYAGPYLNEQDAFDSVPEDLRHPGRKVGIYKDSTKREVLNHAWARDSSDKWVIIKKEGQIYTSADNSLLINSDTGEINYNLINVINSFSIDSNDIVFPLIFELNEEFLKLTGVNVSGHVLPKKYISVISTIQIEIYDFRNEIIFVTPENYEFDVIGIKHIL